MAGETNLIAAVPAAELAVSDYRARFDPSAADGAPAHVTVLAPFLGVDSVTSGARTRLRGLFAAIGRFDFSLVRVARFPGLLYLAPDPSEPFIALTEAVWRSWPKFPPYRGAYDEIVPHLTVAVGDDRFVEVEQALTPLLPIAATAHEVWLIARRAHGRWVRTETFALGSAGR